MDICILKVCVRVCLLWVVRKREERRCRKGGWGVQEKMKEKEPGKKSRRAQRNKSAELYPPGTERTEGGKRKEKRKTWTPDPSYPQHTPTHTFNTPATPFSHVFTMFCITWHFYIFTGEWLWCDVASRHGLWLKYSSRESFVSTITRQAAERLPLSLAIKVSI